jgi:hypothetical protein
MRTRLQCKQFLCARARIKNRSGRKWQMWDSDHFLRKICGLWIWPSTINNTCTQFLHQKFHPIHVWEQTVGTLITGTSCISRDSHFKTICMMHLYQSWFQFIIDCSEACGPCSLTVSYSNCKCLHHSFLSAVSVNTQTCGLYPSQQLTIWCCLES